MGETRTFKKFIQQGRRRIETGGVPSGYVEDFDEPRTTLGDFFNVLLIRVGDAASSDKLQKLLPGLRLTAEGA